MTLISDTHRWGSLAKALHWLTALAIIALGIIGLIMTEMANTPAKIKIYSVHKSIGLSVLALVILRLIWRCLDRHPEDPPGMPPWQHWASRTVHATLYILMFALPLSGWLFNSAKNFPLAWFGLIPIPSLTSGYDGAIAAIARNAHKISFWILVAVLVIHVGAALKHHFYNRDNVLTRMLP